MAAPPCPPGTPRPGPCYNISLPVHCAYTKTMASKRLLASTTTPAYLLDLVEIVVHLPEPELLSCGDSRPAGRQLEVHGVLISHLTSLVEMALSELHARAANCPILHAGSSLQQEIEFMCFNPQSHVWPLHARVMRVCLPELLCSKSS